MVTGSRLCAGRWLPTATHVRLAVAAAGILAALGGCGAGDLVTTEGGNDAGGSDGGAGGSGSGDARNLEAGPADTRDAADEPPPPAVDPTDRSKCSVDPDKLGMTTRTATLTASRKMTYLGFAPPGYAPKVPVPLVVGLHGSGGMNPGYFTRIWQDNATREGFLVVTPEGTAPEGTGFTWDEDDRDLILAVIDDFERCYSVDRKRRILNGHSAGGIVTYLLGLEAANTFAGLAVSAADLASAEFYARKKLLPAPWKIPVSHFHGLSDQNFPIKGAREGRDRLIAAGHKVFWHEFDGGHMTNAEFAATMYGDLASSRAP